MFMWRLLVLLAAITVACLCTPSLPKAGAQAAQAPEPRRGFQMGFRPNGALPLGEAFGGVDLSVVTSPTYGIDLDVGWKPTPNLFLGGRPTLGFGSVGSADELLCDDSLATCLVFRGGLGAEVQYHFLPGARFNPWLGYGLGFEVLQVTRNHALAEVHSTFLGFDFARLTAGADWRLSRGFGLGLFVDFAIGMYLNESISVDGETRASDGIDDTAMHYWLSMGPRFVLFP